MLQKTDFLLEVLSKVARRYNLKGRLSGVMKVGSSLSTDHLHQLHNFFGIAPIRVNSRNEVRIHFDIALNNDPEPIWIENISVYLGYRLRPGTKTDSAEFSNTLLSRLQLAFPELKTLVKQLQKSPADLQRILSNNSEQESTEIFFRVAETVSFLLKNQTPVTISELGARFFNNSKILRQGEIRNLLLRWVNVYCPDVERAENEEQIWATYHVYHDRLTVNAVVYGPIIYTKNDQTFDWIFKLYQQGEAATISWSNLQNIEKMQWMGCKENSPNLICCENEAPFSQLMREQSGDIILFTSGFPGSAVRKIFEMLAPRASSCYHWGDTDPNGLRIAYILHSTYPLQLYRCDITTLKQHEKYLLPLLEKQKKVAQEILKDDKFPFKQELLFTLRKGWLEQESWLSI